MVSLVQRTPAALTRRPCQWYVNHTSRHATSSFRDRHRVVHGLAGKYSPPFKLIARHLGAEYMQVDRLRYAVAQIEAR